MNESIPAHYFLDLAVAVSAPDHSRLTKFKNPLLENHAWGMLEEIYDGMILAAVDHGLEFGPVQIVDSVHTRADVNAKKDKERQEKGGAPRGPRRGWWIRGSERPWRRMANR